MSKISLKIKFDCTYVLCFLKFAVCKFFISARAQDNCDLYTVYKIENLGYPFHWMCLYTENDLKPHLYFKHGMQIGDKFWIFDGKVMDLAKGTKS